MEHSLTYKLVVLGSALVCSLLMTVYECYGVNLAFVLSLIGFIMFGDLSDHVDMVHLSKEIMVWFVILFGDLGFLVQPQKALVDRRGVN